MKLEWWYHWSPKPNREEILQDGLQVMHNALGFDEEELEEFGLEDPPRFPWLCLSPDPYRAWSQLPIDPVTAEFPWDCWMVRIAEGDRVEYQSKGAPHVMEVRVHHSLPPDRLWWVAERHYNAHESI